MPLRNALAPSNQNSLRMQSDMGVAPQGFRFADSIGRAPEAKGLGYFGKINTPGKDFMTELSTTFEFDGKPMTVPLFVPTLDANEIELLRSGGKPTENIYNKAYEHAMLRLRQNKDAFATPQDLRYPLPK
jgi:hypothetical protein